MFVKGVGTAEKGRGEGIDVIDPKNHQKDAGFRNENQGPQLQRKRVFTEITGNGENQGPRCTLREIRRRDESKEGIEETRKSKGVHRIVGKEIQMT